MCWVQLLTSTLQSLCISMPKILLHVTLKRRAEISADIFARRLWYFRLSFKNLTITDSISVSSSISTRSLVCKAGVKLMNIVGLI